MLPFTEWATKIKFIFRVDDKESGLTEMKKKDASSPKRN